jgi:hypothetical protein
MISKKLLRSAVATVTVVGTTVGIGLISTGPASANTSYTCSESGDWCQADVFSGAVIHGRNGGQLDLRAGAEILITCYYSGNASDGWWDHVTFVYGYGSYDGHIDDGFVNFDGNTPNHLPGNPLDVCGTPT